MIVEMNL